jgi:hypothetical protein
MEPDNRPFDAPLVAAVTSARVLALEYAVQLLIATHPDRKALRGLWHALLPEQLDAWLQEPGYAANDVFRKGLHAQLARLGGYLDVELPSADE